MRFLFLFERLFHRCICAIRCFMYILLYNYCDGTMSFLAIRINTDLSGKMNMCVFAVNDYTTDPMRVLLQSEFTPFIT